MENKRCEWLDALKGMLILFVILGHASDRTLNSFENDIIIKYLNYFIYGFHMAVFFSVSGYIYNLTRPNFKCKNDWHTYKNFFIKKLWGLALPYILFGVLIWIGKTIFSKFVIVQTSIRDLLLIVIVPIAFLWFIYVLFEIEVLVGFIDMRTNCNFAIMMSVGILMQILSFFVNTGSRGIDYFLYFTVFFVFGMFISAKNNILNNKKIVIIAGIVFILGTVLRFYMDGRANNVTKLITSYSGIIVFMKLFIVFGCKKWKWGYSFLVKIGKNTMYYYIMHSVFISGIRVILIKCGVELAPVWLVVLFIGSFICCYVSILAVKKIKCVDFLFSPRKYLKVQK